MALTFYFLYPGFNVEFLTKNVGNCLGQIQKIITN
jgi:hypothetical protein